MRLGRDVVVDLSMWRRSTRDRYRALVEQAGGRWRLVYLRASPDLLRRRLDGRSAREDANARFPITAAILDRYLRGFEAPDGEGEEIVDVDSAELVERVRRLCLPLPEVTERLSHGEPTWFVRGRTTFVMFADHHHDDRVGFVCAAGPGGQEALLAADPERFYYPPYVGHRGWVGVRLDVEGVDWTEVDELVVDAYRAVAPKRLVALLDSIG